MTDEQLKLAAYQHAQDEFVKRLKKDAAEARDAPERKSAEVTDESFPLGCGAGVTTGRFHLAGCATGRWPADQKNESAPPRLAKATVTITREEIDALIGFYNKAIREGVVNEVVCGILCGIVETSFGDRTGYLVDGALYVIPRR